jgi:hypothetical protein
MLGLHECRGIQKQSILKSNVLVVQNKDFGQKAESGNFELSGYKNDCDGDTL